MSTRSFGQPIKRNEDARLLRGKALFVDDVELPRLLHAAFVRSPYAHARIRSIDTAAARKLPGVIAVYTAADLGDYWQPGPLLVPPPPIEGITFNKRTQVPLVKDKVRHAGEPIAVVIAPVLFGLTTRMRIRSGRRGGGRGPGQGPPVSGAGHVHRQRDQVVGREAGTAADEPAVLRDPVDRRGAVGGQHVPDLRHQHRTEGERTGDRQGVDRRAVRAAGLPVLAVLLHGEQVVDDYALLADQVVVGDEIGRAHV